MIFFHSLENNTVQCALMCLCAGLFSMAGQTCRFFFNFLLTNKYEEHVYKAIFGITNYWYMTVRDELHVCSNFPRGHPLVHAQPRRRIIIAISKRNHLMTVFVRCSSSQRPLYTSWWWLPNNVSGGLFRLSARSSSGSNQCMNFCRTRIIRKCKAEDDDDDTYMFSPSGKLNSLWTAFRKNW